MPWIDRALWVQSDLEEAERCGIARDGGTQEAGAEEFDFLQRQRPWERATVIVNGTPTQPYDQRTEIMLAPALSQSPLLSFEANSFISAIGTGLYI
jgi:hypothetical protein